MHREGRTGLRQVAIRGGFLEEEVGTKPEVGELVPKSGEKSVPGGGVREMAGFGTQSNPM